MDAANATLRAVIQLVAGILYLYVGSIVLRRQVDPPDRRANRLFALWWIALAGAFAASALAQLLAIAALMRTGLAAAIFNLELALLVAGIWGLVYYLVYLFTGNDRWYPRTVAFYVVLAALMEAALIYLRPNGFDDTGAPTLANAPLPPAIGLALSLMLLGPILVAAVAYGSLFFRTREALVRYRVGLVAVAFILQAVWSLLSSALRLPAKFPNSLGFTAVATSISVVAALLVLAAFRPPKSILRAPHERQDRKAALMARIRDLV